MRLTGKDRVLTVFDQGPADGTPTSPGTEKTLINAIVKTIRYSAKGNTTDVHCPADGYKYLRGTFASKSIDVECAVEGSTGRVVFDRTHYYQANIKALSTLSAAFTFVGHCTKDDWNSGGDGPQTQSFTFSGPAEIT